MVTNRRIIKGQYADEEKHLHKFEYQYQYNKVADCFEKRGKRGFEVSLFNELKRLKESGINTPKVGVYLHGFNNNYQDSIDEIYDLEAHLSKAIGYQPIIIGFSWPSTGSQVSYLSDREEVRDSVGAYTRFLLDIDDLANRNQQDCFSSAFCIAHSMGNYLLRKGMEYLSDALGSPTGRKLFDETIMIAPDLSSNDVNRLGKGQYIAHFSRRVHVYYSKHDRALKCSSIKRFGGNRLGRHGANSYDNLPTNVVVVDAKKYANQQSIKGVLDRQNKQVSVHSAHRYHEHIIADIVQVIASIDRHEITNRVAYENEGEALNNHFKLV